MLVRAGAVVAAGCLLLVSCSSDDSPSTTDVVTTSSSTATTSTTTTVKPTTTSSTSTTTTTTTSTTTTTTVAPTPVLSLRDDGLGEARFGTDADAVVEFVNSLLGDPTTDSGWVPAAGQFGSCPGTEVRGVSWRDLTLMFGDASTVTSGRPHFFAYVYGPAFARTGIDPPGLQTVAGIGIGSTVAQLRAAYPAADVHEGDRITPPGFSLGDDFSGILTGVTDADTVRAIAGGVGCGE
jgi:hypothetical protein